MYFSMGPIIANFTWTPEELRRARRAWLRYTKQGRIHRRDVSIAFLFGLGGVVAGGCYWSEMVPDRQLLEAERPAWERLNRTQLNFASDRPVVPKENMLLIEPMYDLFVGTEGIEDLWQAWGQPEMWRLRHGHVSKVLVPGLTGRVLRWLGVENGCLPCSKYF